MNSCLSRRQFCMNIAGAVSVLALGGRASAAPLSPHPGITGAKVASRDHLADKPQLVELFDAVRTNPSIVDGIRCNSGCSHNAGFFTLCLPATKVPRPWRASV